MTAAAIIAALLAAVLGFIAGARWAAWRIKRMLEGADFTARVRKDFTEELAALAARQRAAQMDAMKN